EHLCNGCVSFLKQLHKQPGFAHLPVLLDQQPLTLLGMPEELKASLDKIENISEDSMAAFCSGGSWESQIYFNQINSNIIEKMKKEGNKLAHPTLGRFQYILRECSLRGPIKFLEHLNFLRQTIS